MIATSPFQQHQFGPRIAVVAIDVTKLGKQPNGDGRQGTQIELLALINMGK
jgi:hypothetical protein